MSTIIFYTVLFVVLVVLGIRVTRPRLPAPLKLAEVPDELKPPERFQHYDGIWFDIQHSDLYIVVSDEEYCYGLFVQHFKPEFRHRRNKTPYGLVWHKESKEVCEFVPIMKITHFFTFSTPATRWVATTLGERAHKFLRDNEHKFESEF